MKYLALIGVILLCSSFIQTSSAQLFDGTLEIEPYDTSRLGNSTNALLLWLLHNETLDGEELVMNFNVRVVDATDTFTLHVEFFKMYTGISNVSYTYILDHKVVILPSLKERESAEISILWNVALAVSFDPDKNGPAWQQVHYFEGVRIWLSRSGFWDMHVKMDIDLWTSNRSSRLDDGNQIYVLRTFEDHDRNWLFILPTPIVFASILWRKKK